MQKSSSPRQTFRGVTYAIFGRLRKKASRMGIAITGPIGDAVKNGIKLHWNYDPVSEQLDVECVSAPFWIDSKQVSENLRTEIEAVLEQSRAA
ncbi:hypothetical protein [Granulicella sp. S156]|uniref:hypothetical protein n=1 Tax=Granulicella sp. S156 TaxID=1747224 RepID=UPI00131B4467|nr:hypothetical protein [Granulicella sp. S156]